MPSIPRNLRTKTPRPVRVAARPSAPASLSDSWADRGTPTPAPVTVSLTPSPPASSPRAVGPERGTTPESKRRWPLVAMTLLAMAVVATAFTVRTLKQRALTMPQAAAMQIHALTPAPAPQTSAASSVVDDNDWQVRHDGHVPIAGGVLVTPKTFTTKQGRYDLIIHFHGNRHIVAESVEHAGINAALAIINVGVRSGPYRDLYSSPEGFDQLLVQINRGLKRRGVHDPELGRLALISWSAGYGAIESILQYRHSPPPESDPLDAIIALDGVHASFVDGDASRLSERSMAAFLNAARGAAQGTILLSLTHSEIDPVEYASTKRTQEYILGAVGGRPNRGPMLHMPTALHLESARGAVPQGKDKRMVPLSDTRIGSLRIQGFEGITAEHHSAHLTQMAAIALPDLAKRWASE